MSDLRFEDTDTILVENRLFQPPQETTDNSNIVAYMKSKGFANYEDFYQWSLQNRNEFWDDMARELHWFEPWHTTFEWTHKPFFKWFSGGKTNIVYNALDRHKGTSVWHKAAFHWESDNGASTRTLTYKDLYVLVNRFAKGLQNLGVGKGDRVAIYMPMVPELAAALLAVTRLGAVHTVVFGGFAAPALSDRINDAQAKVVITADGNYRGGKLIELKKITDEALKDTPTIEHSVVINRLGLDVNMEPGRDVYLEDLLADVPEDTEVPCAEMDSEDMLYILYTSGSTGRPKGVVHVHGGYSVGVYATTKFVFDLKPDDIYWCAADIGWVTGHSYIVYGPLMNGVTSILFEGTPVYPQPDRIWQLINKYK